MTCCGPPTPHCVTCYRWVTWYLLTSLLPIKTWNQSWHVLMVQGEQMGWEYLEKGGYYSPSLWDWSEGKSLGGYEQMPAVFCTKVNCILTGCWHLTVRYGLICSSWSPVSCWLGSTVVCGSSLPAPRGLLSLQTSYNVVTP